jgi:hypothetical protein
MLTSIADSVIAKEFVDVVAGTSPYATQYGAKNF